MKILITGASKGIGLFLMKKFSEKGKAVFGTYNPPPPASSSLNFEKVDITNYDNVCK